MKSIHLKNFQRHSDLHIDLDDVTVIRGSSDKGKSSIFRALYWLAFNRPVGADFYKKEKTDEFSVTVVLDDGTEIERGKTKKESYYRLNDEVFKSVGTDVPEPIIQALRLDSLNFAGQHDPEFLLSMSKPEVSRYISSLVGLEEMDKALSFVESKRRKLLQDIEYTEQQKDEVKSQLKFLKPVKRMSEKIKELNAIDETASALEDKVDKIKELHSDGVTWKTKAAGYDSICALSDSVEELVRLQESFQSLQSLYMQHTQVYRVLNTAELVEQADSCILSLCNAQNSITTLQTKQSDLARSLQALYQAQQGIDALSSEIAELQIEWDEETVGYCPFCGEKMKGESCEH